MQKIFVFGSINVDLVISAKRLPKLGESLKGHGFMTTQGGKGANQAVACKKLGARKVMFLGAIGKDLFGSQLKNSLQNFGVDVSMLKTHENSNSGVCFIVLDECRKDNYLIVDGGANDLVRFCDYADVLDQNAAEGDIFLSQLEISADAVKEGLAFAKRKKMYTVLNPAPAIKIGPDFLKNVDLLVLNETETEIISGIPLKTDKDLLNAGRFFITEGVKEAVITLGAKGSCYYNGKKFIKIAAKKVNAVDTTSAGDTFIGALALKKALGENIEDSLEFASACSAITVSRKGAAVSIPTKEEAEAIMCSNYGYR